VKATICQRYLAALSDARPSTAEREACLALRKAVLTGAGKADAAAACRRLLASADSPQIRGRLHYLYEITAHSRE